MSTDLTAEISSPQALHSSGTAVRQHPDLPRVELLWQIGNR